ncbi:uncharacterized protein JCM15063_000502 [Sporobolomyces koalae]|uniref:uncharacterized protein n=1 Tax=Sporobolomyces koalae TaxID=500713 RepID=UPI0031739558
MSQSAQDVEPEVSETTLWHRVLDKLAKLGALYYGGIPGGRTKIKDLNQFLHLCWPDLTWSSKKKAAQVISKTLEVCQEAARSNATSRIQGAASVLHEVPSASKLLEILRNTQLETTWITDLPRKMMDDELRHWIEPVYDLQIAQDCRTAVRKSRIYGEWETLDPECQAEALHYTSQQVFKVAKWNETRLPTPGTRVSEDAPGWKEARLDPQRYETIFKEYEPLQDLRPSQNVVSGNPEHVVIKQLAKLEKLGVLFAKGNGGPAKINQLRELLRLCWPHLTEPSKNQAVEVISQAIQNICTAVRESTAAQFAKKGELAKIVRSDRVPARTLRLGLLTTYCSVWVAKRW